MESVLSVANAAAATEYDIFRSHDFNDFITTLAVLTTEYAPQDIYALVDVDYTITVPAHPATHAPNLKQHYAQFSLLTQTLNPDELEKFENLVLIQQPQQVIDPKVHSYLAQLKKSQIKTTAITAMLSAGPTPDMQSMAQWRYESLKSLSIDFSDSFPHVERVDFTDIPAYLAAHPQYYKGILCTNGELGQHHKGTVLDAFLQKIDYRPKVIVMIDDRLKNLEDVQATLKNSGIRFIGFDYQAGLQFTNQSVDQQAFTQFWADVKKAL